MAMTRGLVRSWRERGGRNVRVVLQFDDLMALSLALLSVAPPELNALGWSFADRKRLLDHFLSAGKAAQGFPHDTLEQARITVDLPQRDVDRLQAFARRSLPKAAPNAAMLGRVLTVLNAGSHRRET